MKKKILFIVSSADKIGPDNRKTGNFLPEVAHPYHEFIEAGYAVDFASVQGGEPPIDGADDLSDPRNKAFIEGEGMMRMKSSLKISEVDTAPYDAVFVPGGLGPMVDMPNNVDVQKAIAATYDRGDVVGAVCHGPVSLLNVTLSDGTSLIQGKKLTSFSNSEESGYAENDVPFLLESALREKGAAYSSVDDWQALSIADGRLITGQNPASAEGVARKMIAAIEEPVNV